VNHVETFRPSLSLLGYILPSWIHKNTLDTRDEILRGGTKKSQSHEIQFIFPKNIYVNIRICISQGHALCVHSQSTSAFTTLTHPCTGHCADLCAFLGIRILQAHLGGYFYPELNCDILGTKHCALLSGCCWCATTFLDSRCSTNPIVLRSQPHRRAWNRFLLKKRSQNFSQKNLGLFLQFDSLSNTDTHTHTYTHIHIHTHAHTHTKTNKHVHTRQPFDTHNTLSSRYAEICSCIHLCVCVCVCVCVCICLCVYVCMCVYLCVFMCVCVCLCVCVFVRECTEQQKIENSRINTISLRFVHTHTNAHTNMQTTHTHTHAHTQPTHTLEKNS